MSKLKEDSRIACSSFPRPLDGFRSRRKILASSIIFAPFLKRQQEDVNENKELELLF